MVSSYLKLRYVWLDGTKGLPCVRAKTMIMRGAFVDVPTWTRADLLKLLASGSFRDWRADGSSTEQADTNSSDILLRPVNVFRDPIRFDGVSFIVLCEVFNYDGTEHKTNTRAAARVRRDSVKSQEPCCTFEQEFVLRHVHQHNPSMPLAEVYGFPTDLSQRPEQQGKYYCGVGRDRVFGGREIVEEMMDACLNAGIEIQGENSEVLPGQWEFQIGGANVDALEAADQLWVARMLMQMVGERWGLAVDFSPKPVDLPGEEDKWNGSGCHTNFSTRLMRHADSLAPATEACKRLSQSDRIEAHLAVLGESTDRRLIGKCETGDPKVFTWGVGNREASVRIPTELNGNNPGYIEDRRPSANCDPYKVVEAMMTSVCETSKASEG